MQFSLLIRQFLPFYLKIKKRWWCQVTKATELFLPPLNWIRQHKEDIMTNAWELAALLPLNIKEANSLLNKALCATLATSSCEKHIRDPLHCPRLNILHRCCICRSIVAGRFRTCSSRCSLFLSLSHREDHPRNVPSTLWGFQQQPEALRWESRAAESQCLLFMRTLALLVRLWENYNGQINCFFSAAGQKWLPSIHSLPRPCVPLCLILLSRVKRRRKTRTVVVRRGGRWGEREKARDWVGELVQYFDNGYLWKKPTRSSGHGGGACREKEKTKHTKQKNVHSGIPSV